MTNKTPNLILAEYYLENNKGSYKYDDVVKHTIKCIEEYDNTLHFDEFEKYDLTIKKLLNIWHTLIIQKNKQRISSDFTLVTYAIFIAISAIGCVCIWYFL